MFAVSIIIFKSQRLMSVHIIFDGSHVTKLHKMQMWSQRNTNKIILSRKNYVFLSSKLFISDSLASIAQKTCDSFVLSVVWEFAHPA